MYIMPRMVAEQTQYVNWCSQKQHIARSNPNIQTKRRHTTEVCTMPYQTRGGENFHITRVGTHA
eukprot:605011-Amphidinium_carterae.2